MGDVVGLVRDFEQVVDQREAEADAERLLRGHFGLEDLLKQLRTIQRMGPLREVFAKLPGIGGLAEQVDERELVKVESLIRSMTPGERARPETIDKSRAARIARGSGRRSRDVRDLVDRFVQMRGLLGAMGSGGLLSRIPGLGRLSPAGAGAPAGLLPSAPVPGSSARDSARRRARQKEKRKQARKARKRNRRR
jgi:signal recognition particle subunit SRP54